MQAIQALPLYNSTIGKKVLMAITGLIWIGYVVAHMYGNLKIFAGEVYFIEYAEGLRHLGAPVMGTRHFLMIARVVLTGSILIHVWAAVTLYRQARSARPSNYQMQRTVKANYAAKTIRYGGIVILLFVIYHLMHFTLGTPGIHSDFVPGNPYHNVISGFQSPINVAVYLLALCALGLHLYHGTWSMMQTLGFLNRRYDRAVRTLALLVALVVAVGFAVVPIAVIAGYLPG